MENKCTHCKQVIWDGKKRIPHLPGCTNIQPRRKKGEKMKSPMLAVYDKKTGLYDNPFIVRHNGDAIREFDHLRKDTST